MKSHNASTERDYWSKARDRKRIRARFAIRNRITAAAELGQRRSDISADDNYSEAPSSSSSESVVEDLWDSKLVTTILENIVEGNRSYFSTVFMEQHIDLLESRFPIEMMMTTATTASDRTEGVDVVVDPRGLYRLLSLMGTEVADEFRQFVATLESFTILEYATWFRRFHILGGLLMGGVSPTRRDLAVGEKASACLHDDDDDDSFQRKLLDHHVRKCFLENVPKALQVYIVQQSIEMRRSLWRRNSQEDKCQRCAGPASMVYHCCSHAAVCDSCFWSDIVENLHDRRGNVVQCMECEPNGGEGFERLSGNSPEERFLQSLQKFELLPATAKELKNTKQKRKKIREEDLLCESWSKAVLFSCGRSKEVRRDKWLHYGERGALHHVLACLEQLGIDGNIQNDYGQTVLYTSVWRGDIKMVQLLLDNGCDPTIAANDGTTPMDLALFQCDAAIIACLEKAGVSSSTNGGDSPGVPLGLTGAASVSVLIPFTENHPGAGSFLIDHGLTPSAIQYLVDLCERLPVEAPKIKKAGIPCSLRAYYCDAWNLLPTLLTDLLKDQINASANNHNQPNSSNTLSIQLLDPSSVFVWQHMRVLRYETPGAVLAPHVDLCRAHPTQADVRSTHSFLLYLTDNTAGGTSGGGETSLLESLAAEADVLVKVPPKLGRLLVFPHNCPHRGEEVKMVPKVLIRGELYLTRSA